MIEKITKVIACYDRNNVYTILRCPLTSPTYDMMWHVTSVSVYDHDDVFVLVKVNNNRITIDTDRHIYITLTEKDERECIKINSDYLCERNYIIRRINIPSVWSTNVLKKNHYDNCENKLITSPHTLWIRIKNSWIYSVSDKEKVRN